MNKFLFIFISSLSFAGVTELSLQGSYISYNNTAESRTIQTSYGVTLAYRFLAFSSFELGYFNDNERQTQNTDIASLVVRTVGTRYTASWVQNLTGEKSGFQPYFKAGIGYIDREQTWEIKVGDLEYGEKSRGHAAMGITGFGVRMFLTKSFAIRAEATVLWTGINAKPLRHYFYEGGISLFF